MKIGTKLIITGSGHGYKNRTGRLDRFDLYSGLLLINLGRGVRVIARPHEVRVLTPTKLKLVK